MKNTKKKIIVTALIVFALISGIFGYNKLQSKDAKPKGMFAIYIDEGDGNGPVASTSNKWPTDGYELDLETSFCDNGSVLSWDSTNKTVGVSATSGDKCKLYFIKADYVFGEWLKSNVTIVTSNDGLYHHTSDTSAVDYVANSAEDNSYRYAGASVDNWICFGSSNGTSCPANNQYRIIGVMSDGTIKIIKSTSIGEYAWEANNDWRSATAIWANSTLNSNLNGSVFLNNNAYMTSSMKSMLVTTANWGVGEIGYNYNYYQMTAYDYYTNEQTSIYTNNSLPSTVALMAPSDYRYSETANYWDRDSYTHSEHDSWMYNSSVEWTITASSACNSFAFVLYYGNIFTDANGCGIYDDYKKADAYNVRPVMFLKSDVQYKTGDGSSTNMYTISLEN